MFSINGSSVIRCSSSRPVKSDNARLGQNMLKSGLCTATQMGADGLLLGSVVVSAAQM